LWRKIFEDPTDENNRKETLTKGNGRQEKCALLQET